MDVTVSSASRKTVLDAVDISLQVARRKMSRSAFTVMNQAQYTAQITVVPRVSNHLCIEIETRSEMVSQLAENVKRGTI